MPEAQARGNLRHLLSRVRAALAGRARSGLVLEGSTVALDPSVVDTDVARLEELVADARPDALAQISEVYRADLLAGLVLTEARFDEWLTSERERLRGLALRGLGHLLRHQQRTGAAEAAVQTGLRLLALDPLQESVHRAVMGLYASLGRPEAALRQYQRCVDALKRELGTRPEAETIRLHQEILGSGLGAKRDDLAPATVTRAGPPGPPPTNLPVAPSELVGREAALAEVTELLDAHRLVTLIGPGGIGKTRLGLEAARGRLPGCVDGAWLAELAPLSDPALVPGTVAAALGITSPAGAESPERVASAVDSKRLLLVLDNCEHVIAAAARMAEALLRANPHARVLATSREPLRAPGERVYRVVPLAVPTGGVDDSGPPRETAAVALFVARAQAIDRGFALDARTGPLARAVCRRLDGIPLAIELAAARSAGLGMDELAAHLDDRFRLLTGGHRTALPRQQTMRATLDWSYELLPTIERTILRRLAVFAGGFTLEAASAVAPGADLAAPVVVESVANLVAKSLVVVEDTGAVTRYRLLETMRAYALEKLGAEGELPPMAARHAAYYRDLLERAESDPETRSTVEWLAVHGRLIHNVRAALDWTFSPGGDAALGLALTVAAVPLWVHLSQMTECCARVERALASRGATGSSDARRDMRLYLALGTALLHTRGVGSPEMAAALATSLQLAEGLDDTEYRLRALFELYVHRFVTGDFRGALALAEQVVAVAARTADPTDALIGRRLIGVVRHILGDQAEAQRHVEPLVGVDFSAGRRSYIARYQFDQRVVTHSFYARIRWVQGFADQAMRVAAEVVDYARDMDHVTSQFYALVQAAAPIALYAGDLTRAERFVKLLTGLAVAQAQEPWSIWAQCYQGVLLVKRAEYLAGSRLLQAGLAGLPEVAFHYHKTWFLAELAEGLGGAGPVRDGLAVIDGALARAEQREEGWLLAELLRKKGELLLLDGAPDAAAEAEECFQQALERARGQDALAWELRSGTSLARLWERRRRPALARRVLQPIVRRFTEGFDTADLQAARALLGQLG
jgi:predicted ATPase/DNA-binding SARP family transcriptional activator